MFVTDIKIKAKIVPKITLVKEEEENNVDKKLDIEKFI